MVNIALKKYIVFILINLCLFGCTNIAGRHYSVENWTIQELTIAVQVLNNTEKSEMYAMVDRLVKSITRLRKTVPSNKEPFFELKRDFIFIFNGVPDHKLKTIFGQYYSWFIIYKGDTNE